MCQWSDDPENIHFEFYGGTKGSNNSITLRMEAYAPEKYVLNDATLRNKPNVKVPLAEFCSAFTHVSRVKYPPILKSFPRGAYLYGGNETRTSKRNTPWGDCNLRPGEHSYEISIPLNVAQGITKMSNFNNGGIVSIHCDNDEFVVFRTSLGCYGSVIIYLCQKKN